MAGGGTIPDEDTWLSTEHCCHRDTSSASTPGVGGMEDEAVKKRIEERGEEAACKGKFIKSHKLSAMSGIITLHV